MEQWCTQEQLDRLRSEGKDLGMVRAKYTKRMSKMKPSKKQWNYFRMFVMNDGRVLIYTFYEGYYQSGKTYKSMAEFFFEWNADKKFVLTEKKQVVSNHYLVQINRLEYIEP